MTEEIQELQKVGKKMEEIQNIPDLSRASINAYLPYSKIPYKESEVSVNADRCELYRKRKAAVDRIDRRGESKSLTMSTILRAYENSIGAGIVDRPKALGDLHGVSYIYPIFFRFGLIEVPEKVKAIMNGKKK